MLSLAVMSLGKWVADLGKWVAGYELSMRDAAAGTQIAEPLLILTACLFSFVVGEHEMRPSGTCYHLNYHCRLKILLILRKLNKNNA